MNHLICEHCDVVALDVMPLAVAITTGSKDIPQTFQKNLCETCRWVTVDGIESVMNDTTMRDFG